MGTNFRFLMLVIQIVLVSCQSAQIKHVNEALKIMERNSINRKTIDWKELKAKAGYRLADIKTIDDGYRSIYRALNLLGDKHSFLFTPLQVEQFNNPLSKVPHVEHKLVNGKFGYIKIPPFMGNDSLAIRFAENIQRLIGKYDQEDVSGWLIDLRENLGGNMWPMFLGLGPILGEGYMDILFILIAVVYHGLIARVWFFKAKD